MTPQEVFDQVTKHLLTQNAVARDDVAVGETGNGCRYRASNGLKCAVGCLIQDEEYALWMEGKQFDSGILMNPLCPISLKERLGPHIQLLRQLQGIHDSDMPWDWKLALQEAADKFHLNWPFFW
jgi:hypothetical protein